MAQSVIYARASSKEQAEEGFSIPAQTKLLRAYALQRGFETAREFVAVETAKRAGRSGFGEMVEYLKRSRGTCRVVLVEKTDRLCGLGPHCPSRPRHMSASLVAIPLRL